MRTKADRRAAVTASFITAWSWAAIGSWASGSVVTGLIVVHVPSRDQRQGDRFKTSPR